MEKKQESIGKKIWRLFYPALIYIGIVSLIEAAVVTALTYRELLSRGVETVMNLSAEEQMVVMQQVMIYVTEKVLAYALEIQAVGVVITLPILLLVLRKDRKRRADKGIVEGKRDLAPIWLAVTAVFGAIAAYAGNGMISLSGLYEVSDSYEEVASVFYQGKLAIELICLGILAPIVEEVIFRGLMYKQLTEYVSKRNAVIVSVLLFGLFHGNFLQAIYGVGLGLLMVYVYERMGTLWAPILFHIGANVFGVLLSETEIFSFLYSTAGAMYASVIICSLLIIGLVWLYEQRNNRRADHAQSMENTEN